MEKYEILIQKFLTYLFDKINTKQGSAMVKMLSYILSEQVFDKGLSVRMPKFIYFFSKNV